MCYWHIFQPSSPLSQAIDQGGINNPNPLDHPADGLHQVKAPEADPQAPMDRVRRDEEEKKGDDEDEDDNRGDDDSPDPARDPQDDMKGGDLKDDIQNSEDQNPVMTDNGSIT